MPIVWKEQMSVGNTIIDDEHKHLICLINSVEIALKAEHHENMLRFLVNELQQYTKNHFDQEESLMLRYKYKDYVNHKIEHQKILEDIQDLKDRLAKTADGDESFSGLEENVVDTLRHWIVDHVINTDLKMKPLFKAYKEIPT